jgi:chromosome segregation ATPase
MIEMPLGLGIILIILVLGLAGFIIYQNRNFKRESIQNDIEICRLREEIKESRNKFEDSCKRYDGLMTQFLRADEKVGLLQNELIQLQSSIQVEAVKNDSKESLEAELENLKALAAQKLLELERISANTKQLTELQEKKILELGELDSGIKALEGRIDGGKKVLESIEDQIKVTEVALADLANLKASVLAIEEGAGTS